MQKFTIGVTYSDGETHVVTTEDANAEVAIRGVASLIPDERKSQLKSIVVHNCVPPTDTRLYVYTISVVFNYDFERRFSIVAPNVYMAFQDVMLKIPYADRGNMISCKVISCRLYDTSGSGVHMVSLIKGVSPDSLSRYILDKVITKVMDEDMQAFYISDKNASQNVSAILLDKEATLKPKKGKLDIAYINNEIGVLKVFGTVDKLVRLGNLHIYMDISQLGMAKSIIRLIANIETENKLHVTVTHGLPYSEDQNEIIEEAVPISVFQ